MMDNKSVVYAEEKLIKIEKAKVQRAKFVKVFNKYKWKCPCGAILIRSIKKTVTICKACGTGLNLIRR